MTSEVALLNKSAIALAADSATTVTYWENNERKTRYFKGANKIFNISSRHPIGMMTFAAASLQGVPWELVIKAYRDHLSRRSHDHLSAYADDFFEFIRNNTLLFPQDVQEQQFVALADRSAAGIIFPILDAQAYQSEPDLGKKQEMLVHNVEDFGGVIDKQQLMRGADKQWSDEALAKFTSVVADHFRNDMLYSALVPADKIELLARVAISWIFKESFRGFEATGLVFAGYGNNEFFPRLEQYRCHALILGRPLFYKESEKVISQENTSDYASLAQSEMINTFIWGSSTTGMSEVHKIFVRQMDTLEEELKKQGMLDTTASLTAVKSEAEHAFRDGVIEYFHNTHQLPMRRVIGNLPIDELAELAETLVNIESLKERVTSPAESVSGPIDVAVISKHDGFIWIKRKHYFNTELNPRFLARQNIED